MPHQHTGTISHQPTLEELTQSIRLLHTELCYWRPCKEQSTKLSINHSEPTVPTIIPSILDTIPTLPISTFDVINTVHSEDSHLATFYDIVIYNDTTIIMSQISTFNESMLASYYRHESNIALLNSFFYSTAVTLYRLGIG